MGAAVVSEGEAEGDTVGDSDASEGEEVGDVEGDVEGLVLGYAEGEEVGDVEGDAEGKVVGEAEGLALGVWGSCASWEAQLRWTSSQCTSRASAAVHPLAERGCSMRYGQCSSIQGVPSQSQDASAVTVTHAWRH